ncbi:unnamed protein product [Candidula unifasciata]|uniref:Ras-related protein Rab-5C n=1 Tax=Candidula unifasciata TaxID=100452 RepID=A0A8S3YQX9_9EUPU|nr:unnamed protein product [Candidula unifasciata]
MSESQSQTTDFINRSTFRVVLLGDQGVGKSSIALRFLRDEYHDHQPPTIGAAYVTQTLKVGNQSVKLDIWDTAGQERFATLAPMYYRTAQSAVVVYDICSKSSFNRGMVWIKELKEQAPVNTIIVLCGNKVDLAIEARAVKAEDAENIAREEGLLFTEVSAKSGQGVKAMFQTIVSGCIAFRLSETIVILNATGEEGGGGGGR